MCERLVAPSLGTSLGVAYHVIPRHLEVFEAVFLIRRLAPWFRKLGKRLTQSPKINIRDSGLLHHLLNISSADELAHGTHAGGQVRDPKLSRIQNRQVLGALLRIGQQLTYASIEREQFHAAANGGGQ